MGAGAYAYHDFVVEGLVVRELHRILQSPVLAPFAGRTWNERLRPFGCLGLDEENLELFEPFDVAGRPRQFSCDKRARG